MHMNGAAKRVAILYHYPCPDGVFSALAAHLYFSWTSDSVLFFPNTVYSPLRAADIPLHQLDDVYLLDFVGPTGFAQEISSKVSRVIILDHHKTALETLGGTDSDLGTNVHTVIDMNRSGATIAYDYFIEKLENSKCYGKRYATETVLAEYRRVRKLFEYIEDGDLWRWKLKDSKAFSSGFKDLKIEFDANLNSLLFKQLLSLSTESIIKNGMESLANKQRLIDGILDQSFEITISGGSFGKCLAVIADSIPELRSELGHQLATKSKNYRIRIHSSPPPMTTADKEVKPAVASSTSNTDGLRLPVTTSTTPNSQKNNKLKLIPLIFLIYFEVAGGPYGEEPAVQAAGPLFAILGFLIFPFIWSVPEALITAELSTAFPGNGGFVIWAERAFGPFIGSMMGSLKFLSGVINTAAFPVLCVDYMKKLFPVLKSGWERKVAITGSTLVLAFLNYTGLAIVGYVAVLLGIVSLAPFIIMSLMAIPQIKPRRWLSLGDRGYKRDWNLFFNTLFWNLNFWDNVSTLAGEVDKPQRTFPVALFSAVILTCFSYLLPLVAVIGAVDVPQEAWGSGFHADAAKMIAGQWLKIWIEIGAVLSAIGLFEAQLSASAYQLEGMADLAIAPKFFSNRAKYFDTPWVGILLSTIVTLGVSFMNFTDLISSANFLYSLGMLIEFSSFLWLRRKMPLLKRPFRVPMKLPGLIVMCLIPSAFLVVIMVIATKMVFLVSGLMTAGSIGWYFLMKLCRSKEWIKFSSGGRQEYEEEEDD